MPILWMLLALSAPAAETTTADAQPVFGLTELRAGVSSSLKTHATAKTDEERDAAAEQLIAWYARVMLNEDLLPQNRSYLRGKLRTRLQAIERRLIKQAGRSSRDAASESGELTDERRAELLATAKAMAGRQDSNGARGGQAVHHGDALMELIQATISPNSWEELGGRGVIRLFAPGGVPR